MDRLKNKEIFYYVDPILNELPRSKEIKPTLMVRLNPSPAKIHHPSASLNPLKPHFKNFLGNQIETEK
jgi:Trp operon repressor